MKSVIDLQKLSELPEDFIIRMRSYNGQFARQNFIEQFMNADFHQLIMDIDNFCLENSIIGYHYTNAIENDIRGSGIIVRTGKEIRQHFIKRHFHLFTIAEQKQILFQWHRWFDEEEAELRDSIVHFNFTTNALKNGGAELLLKYYGGEQVYSPIYQLPVIGEKLKVIGVPMILKCILNPNDLYPFIDSPWGKLIVSSYHKLINPDAYVLDPEAYQKVGVNPENIEIIKL